MKRIFSAGTIGIIIVLLAFGYLVYQLVGQSRVAEPEHVANMDVAQKEKEFPKAIELVSPQGFINTDGIKIADLIGKKVIMVDFWTYSCINCQRTIPYLNAWYDKYKDKGLEIIGVHTPEFSFEKDINNVRDAVTRYSIKYPVVLDNNYTTWNAYQNKYWPRKYLIDIDGFIVYDHIGEGAYDETEMKIKDLLRERDAKLNTADTIDETIASPSDVENAPALAVSPETYFGANRNTSLISNRGLVGEFDFTEPSGTDLGYLYLSGKWNIDSEFAQNKSAGAKIIYRFHANKVFLVASSDTETTAKVLIDGKPVTSAVAGADVKNGEVKIKEDRLYRLIEDAGPGEHVIEIILGTSGVKAYTFTFG